MSLRRPTVALLLFYILTKALYEVSHRRPTEACLLFLTFRGVASDTRSTFFLFYWDFGRTTARLPLFISVVQTFNTYVCIINSAHVHHVCICYILCPNCLRVHSKYSLACPWLLSWPDVDEGDLMDEEFDSEFDA